jgi:ribosomal protein L7/L12
MKKGKFTLVQQYVIDSLMNNNHLVIDDILSAISMICSEEKLNEILSILINKARNQEIDKISSKAESLTTQSIVRVSLEIPGSFYNIGERCANRIKLIKIIKESTSLDLKDAKDFADLVKESVILQYQEVIKLKNALKEYGIKVCIIQQ